MSDTLERVTKAIIDTVDTRKDDYECLIELEAQAAIDEHLQCLIEKAERGTKGGSRSSMEYASNTLFWLKAQKNGNTA